VKKRRAALPQPGHAHDSAEWLKMERLLLFTDAVFAIIVTLLALEIRLPDDAAIDSTQAVLHTLHQMQWKFGAYALSFAVIAMLWNVHLRRYRHVIAVNGKIVMGNMLQLMLVGLIPFVTSAIARGGNSMVVTLYAAVILANVLVSWVTWLLAVRNPAMVRADLTRAMIREGNQRATISALVFALSIAVAWWSPTVAMLSWALLIPANKVIDRMHPHPD
jgi:uncharacterized membrane protein